MYLGNVTINVSNIKEKKEIIQSHAQYTSSFSTIRTIFQLVATCLPINRLETRETGIFGCPSVVRDMCVYTYTFVYTYIRASFFYI